MTLDKGPDPRFEPTGKAELDAVSEQYYSGIEFHAAHEIELPELWMLGLDPVNILDRALSAERFDPPTCNEDKRRLAVCDCPTCKRRTP